MRTAFSTVVLVLAVGSSTVLAAEQAFYRQFQAVRTNYTSGSLASPLLVDTNNTLPKIADTRLSLVKILRAGEIGGVGVQMSMDEVVEHWGKPPSLSISSLGEPFLRYKDVNVLFWPGTNHMITMNANAANKRFENGLSSGSSTNDFLAFLGKPSKVIDIKGALLALVYDSPKVRMYLYFRLGNTNELCMIELDRPPGRTLPDR